jgi:hypothetical protein
MSLVRPGQPYALKSFVWFSVTVGTSTLIVYFALAKISGRMNHYNVKFLN